MHNRDLCSNCCIISNKLDYFSVALSRVWTWPLLKLEFSVGFTAWVFSFRLAINWSILIDKKIPFCVCVWCCCGWFQVTPFSHSFTLSPFLSAIAIMHEFCWFFSLFCNKNASFTPGSRCQSAASGAWVGSVSADMDTVPSADPPVKHRHLFIYLFAVCTCQPRQCTRATYWQMTAEFPFLLSTPQGKIPNSELQSSLQISSSSPKTSRVHSESSRVLKTFSWVKFLIF